METAQPDTSPAKVVSPVIIPPQFSTTQAAKPAPSQAVSQPAIVKEVSKPQMPTDTVVYRVKPFKDNEFGTGYWQSFLKSFMDVSQSIQYIVTGNRASLTMYAVMPASIGLYFENVFYANYPTSELIKEVYTPVKTQFWISYGEKDVLTVDKDFMREGKYLDPLKDIFGVFDNIDATQQLSFSFTYTFKSEKDFWEVFFGKVSDVLQKIFSKKEEVKEAVKEEKPEDAVKCKVAIGIGYQ